MNEKTINQQALANYMNNRHLELTNLFNDYTKGNVKVEAFLNEIAAFRGAVELLVSFDLLPHERFNYLESLFKMLDAITGGDN